MPSWLARAWCRRWGHDWHIAALCVRNGFIGAGCPGKEQRCAQCGLLVDSFSSRCVPQSLRSILERGADRWRIQQHEMGS